MSSMFGGCISLSSLDVSGFNTENVTEMDGMFFCCSSLGNLDISGFDTSKVTYMGYMFYSCANLKKIKLGQLFQQKNTTLPDLPLSPMYDAQGNEYTSFPTGLTESIWLYADINDITNKGTQATIQRQERTYDLFTEGTPLFFNCLTIFTLLH